MYKTDNRVTALYICYWSLMDPLCQTQSLAYLKKLAAQGERFALMTFEQARYKLDASEMAATKLRLAGHGIYWYPLKYHKRFPLLATAYDCLRGVGVGVFIALRHKARVVHSRSSIPAAIALGVSFLSRTKFLYDADSRLSEEYADTGHWSRGSLAFRITSRMERIARMRANSIVVLSRALSDDFIGPLGVRVPVEVIPCCVDTQKLQFNSEARARRRAELAITSERLFVYAGKMGSRYLVAEMLDFFNTARERDSSLRLLVLTNDPHQSFHDLARARGIDRPDYDVKSAAHSDVPEWLSAADAGLAFIRSAECERGSSPVKIGEYLSVGLPVLVTDGIGDYSTVISRERLGVALKDLSPTDYVAALDALNQIWAEGDCIRDRCRAWAQANISLEAVGATRYRFVYQGLLGSAIPLTEPGEERPVSA